MRKNFDKDAINLPDLLDGKDPNVAWCIDQLGNIRAINLLNETSCVVCHLCEMDQQYRDLFIAKIVEIAENMQVVCDVTDSKPRNAKSR